MLKLLRIITYPIFMLAAFMHLVFVFPWKDGGAYARYLVVWKWSDDEDKMAAIHQQAEINTTDVNKTSVH